MSEPQKKKKAKRLGPVAWMTTNSVAANLVMLVLVFGGLLVGSRVKQEVFPEFTIDMVAIGVPYPGASPEEVEKGIILAVEEEIRGLDGVKRVTSTARPSAAAIMVELETKVNANKLLSDTKAAVDRITSFPEEAEEPSVSLVSLRQRVVQVVLHGDQTEEAMRQIADRVRDDLLLLDDITYIELDGIRQREIAVEVSQENLRRYNLTLGGIAQEISRLSLELPGGGVKTRTGEVLLRTAERKERGDEFSQLPLLVDQGGAAILLGDIAQVRDGFVDEDAYAKFKGERAVMLNVFRSGEQTPIEVADAVYKWTKDNAVDLPPGVGVAVLNDRSEMYRQRVDLLIRNARLGLILVLIILGLFLNVRLAFWVTMGIPISFLGSLLLMPALDVSINMISLFAFIITLGIVVDDAIVVGENIYEMKDRGMKPLAAAVKGAQQISVPVVFSVLTTVAAFMPLFLVPGASGKFFRVIPSIVICVLIISLIESLFVLPAHLAHRGKLMQVLWRFFASPFSKTVRDKPLADPDVDDDVPPNRFIQMLERPGIRFSAWLNKFTEVKYGPFLEKVVRLRYLTVAIGICILFWALGFIASGRIDFTFMPKIETDVVTVAATLEQGAAVAESEAVMARIVAAAEETLKKQEGEISRGIFTQLGSAIPVGGGPRGPVSASSGSHVVGVQVFLVTSDLRKIGAGEFARQWGEEMGALPDQLDSLTFHYSTGHGSGPSMEVQLAHTDIEVLEKAAGELANKMRTYSGVRDIDDGFEAGKPQLDFRLTPEGRSLGLTAAGLGRQMRSAFYGAEALRQQRGRDEVRVMVRLPESERRSVDDVEGLLVRTPTGGEVPLLVAANIERGSAYTSIKRADGRRVVTVAADTIAGQANSGKIMSSLKKEYLPELVQNYRGLTYSFEGNRRRQGESMAALKSGYLLALFVIFALLAVPFKSYIQPVVVMSAIPFGIVGALLGHLIMGYDLSLISVMGIVAVSGIVVNDSLVLVHAANEARDSGMSSLEAIHIAGKRRLRPILLTSLTTFFGLMPMILETSVQARFLIPMAISLGFGVLFATFIILMIVPSLYMIVEDLRTAVFGDRQRTPEPVPN